MTQFCLVRHGQTDWNLEGRYQGQSDVPLNATGRSQAGKLARQLQGQSFAALYSSDLKRTMETADIIASFVHLTVTVEPRLREINQGEWEGQLVDVIKMRYADVWQHRHLNPVSIRPPGGETVGEVAERVYAALNDIVRPFPTGAVMIVSHGLALATIICKANGLPLGQAYRVIPDNAEPIWINWEN